MKDFRVGFSTTSAPISRIIRAVTGSRVSHAFLLYWSDDLDQDMVLEATTEGLRIVSWARFQKSSRVLETLPIAWPIAPALRQHADWLGIHYDFAGLVGAAAVVASGGRLSNPLGFGSDSLFCTEFIVRILRAAGHPGAEALKVEGTTPDQLRAFFKAK